MNTPNPLIPQGSLLEQQKSKGKSNLFIAVFTILAIHVVLFAGLLMQGCKRDKQPSTTDEHALGSGAGTLQTDTNTLATPPSLGGPIGSGTFTPDTNTSVPLATGSNDNPMAAMPALPAVPAATTSAAPVVTTAPILTPSPIGEAAPATTPSASMGGKEYTVVSGDAFYKIAKAHGVSITALAKANPGVDSRKLKVGQKLTIPEAAPTEAAATASAPASGVAATEPAATKETAKTTKASPAGTYTVKAGDTLAKIAREHGTTIKAMRAANSLKTDQLHPGQKLKLPAAKAAKATGSTPANPDKN